MCGSTIEGLIDDLNNPKPKTELNDQGPHILVYEPHERFSHVNPQFKGWEIIDNHIWHSIPSN
jgi:hypothetical protein